MTLSEGDKAILTVTSLESVFCPLLLIDIPSREMTVIRGHFPFYFLFIEG